jgi:hypothetical protein
MDYLNIAEGIIAFRIEYYTGYNDSRWYDSVCIITSSRSIVISYDDANNLLNSFKAVIDGYSEPQVIGVNNYLELSASNTWNQYVHIDRSSIRLGNNDKSLELSKFYSVLQKALFGSIDVKGYRDKSNNIEMRFWANDCQFYLTNSGDLYFIPIDDNPGSYSSAVVDKLICKSEEVRQALGSRRSMRIHADIY